jgi:hypothetical protein
MSLQESHEETYKQTKKRLREYRYRYGLVTAGLMIFTLLFILSLFPAVPVVIVGALGIIYSNLVVPLWLSCIMIFGVLTWMCQRFAKKIEEKRGITLEERMYVHAYEAFNHLREYIDRIHPIASGKLKAQRKVLRILTLLEEIKFPNTTLVREEAVQLWQLTENLRMRILPSIKKYTKTNDLD